MIYYIDEYYDDIYDLIERLTEYNLDEKEELEILREDYPDGLIVQECELRPMRVFKEKDKVLIAEMIEEGFLADNCPEDPDDDFYKKISDAVLEALKPVDMEKLTEALPKLWFPNGEETEYSLKQLEEML